ncbi:MAG: hypothetical protein HYS27_20070 [Deltaproteobacteria bacterium]|nr:hypothetical protein [Deltaproteobacteria bacterium]
MGSPEIPAPGSINPSDPRCPDPFEIIVALCEVEEWELARRLARAEDERAH